VAYCTLQDLLKYISQEELAQLTSEDGSAVDESIVQRAIDDASAEIDAYCAKRYVVPFDSVPELVRKLCVDIAIFNLRSRRAPKVELDEIYVKRYDSAVAVLRRIASGEVTLGEVPDRQESGEHTGGWVSAGTRVFSRDKLEGM